MKRRLESINDNCMVKKQKNIYVNSPTDVFLERAIHNRSLIFNSSLNTYIGFIDFMCFPNDFISLLPNRIINNKVVERRVQENIFHFLQKGTFLDFGTLSFIIIREFKENRLHIVDGQHRIRTLELLKKDNLAKSMFVQVSIKIVNTEQEAIEYTRLSNKQYVSDKRFQCTSHNERYQKQEMIRIFREIWSGAFEQYDKSEKDRIHGTCFQNIRPEVERPNLSDGLVITLMHSMPILIPSRATPELLQQINAYIRELYTDKHIPKRVDKVCGGCMFGMLRNDKAEDLHMIKKINNRFH